MPADYHTHTPLCQHAEGTARQYVEAAVAAKVSEYGISDHAPMQHEPFDDWRMFQKDLPAYFDWIEEAKSLGHQLGLPIRVGLECDWLTGQESWIEHLRRLYPWDYFIGSVHYLTDQWDFDNPKWLGKWASLDIEAAWDQYFIAYRQMVRSGLFNIAGHPDLIKKFGFRPDGDLRRFYEPLIEDLADSKMGIELNTAGWFKPCEEAYPSLEFLKLARQAEIPLFISSDAHAPQEVARHFDKAIELARQAGYQETQKIQQGQMSSETL